MQIQFDTSDDPPLAPNSRYPNQLSLLSLALKSIGKSKAQQFLGFSILHVRRHLDRGAIIFTQQIHTCVSFDAALETNLAIDLVRALQPQHTLAGLYLGRSLQALTLHAMKTDPAGFAPAIIGLCQATRLKPPIEIDALFGRPDITKADINRVAGPVAYFDGAQDAHDRDPQAPKAKDSDQLSAAFEARNQAMWLALVNFMLPVHEQLIAVMSLKPG